MNHIATAPVEHAPPVPARPARPLTVAATWARTTPTDPLLERVVHTLTARITSAGAAFPMHSWSGAASFANHSLLEAASDDSEGFLH